MRLSTASHWLVPYREPSWSDFVPEVHPCLYSTLRFRPLVIAACTGMPVLVHARQLLDHDHWLPLTTYRLLVAHGLHNATRQAPWAPPTTKIGLWFPTMYYVPLWSLLAVRQARISQSSQPISWLPRRDVFFTSNVDYGVPDKHASNPLARGLQVSSSSFMRSAVATPRSASVRQQLHLE